LWGHEETIAQRFERDREKLLPLPATPYEACAKRTTRASSQALVRYETNDYSVPVEYGHRQVLVKASVWELVISHMSEVIARHKRSYGREEMIFDPLHYVSLLEQKSNALDQAAPLAGWQLPEEFTELRRQMEGRLGKRGRREYVQVLRLLETFSLAEVAAGVRHALRLTAPGARLDGPIARFCIVLFWFACNRKTFRGEPRVWTAGAAAKLSRNHQRISRNHQHSVEMIGGLRSI
jgi:hypothetical protein